MRHIRLTFLYNEDKAEAWFSLSTMCILVRGSGSQISPTRARTPTNFFVLGAKRPMTSFKSKSTRVFKKI